MVAVQATRLAHQQITSLRGRHKTAFEQWLNRVKAAGCAALDYRLTGDVAERLCVVHLRGTIRVIVAFASPTQVRVLLVGPHDDADPGLDVYAGLYRQLGIEPPTGKRTKPPCCGPAGEPPVWGDDVETLVDQFRAAARR